MILWTIQHQSILDKLKKDGLYHTSEEQLVISGQSSEEKFAYNWLSSEMENRVSSPPHGVKYPIWAWYLWEGSSGKPDMRKSRYAPKGTPIVRIKLDIPDKKVLLSDFDLWHYALNHWYLATSEADEESFDKIDEQMKEVLIQKSWQYIFDLSLQDDGYVFNNLNRKSIQAIFWELRIENILSVECFLAR